MGRARLPGRRAQLVLDGILVLWTALWLWVGISVGHQVRGLADLSDTAGRLGRAVTAVGQAVREIPLLGDQLSGTADTIEGAGRDAVESARSARGSARELGLLLGLSIAVIPSLPLLLVYIPGRVEAERERRALQRALRTTRGAALDELLARRAIVHLPYRVLRRVSADPAADLRAGRHTALADAELEWFAVTRPAARPRPPRRRNGR